MFLLSTCPRPHTLFVQDPDTSSEMRVGTISRVVPQQKSRYLLPVGNNRPSWAGSSCAPTLGDKQKILSRGGVSRPQIGPGQQRLKKEGENERDKNPPLRPRVDLSSSTVHQFMKFKSLPVESFHIGSRATASCSCYLFVSINDNRQATVSGDSPLPCPSMCQRIAASAIFPFIVKSLVSVKTASASPACCPSLSLWSGLLVL